MNNTWNGYRGYIMQAVLNELENTYDYSLGRINTGGLHVVTTFNQNLMSSLYATVRQADGLMRHCTPPAILAAAAPATCTGLPHWVRTGAVLEQVKTGAILAMYSGQNYNEDASTTTRCSPATRSAPRSRPTFWPPRSSRG